ncbi:hypothetical protein V6C27_02965 [Peptococcaceae bacterium 1198_IL3148]
MMHAKIAFKNAREFQRLLERATTLSNQLEETLRRISDFEVDIHAETKNKDCPDKIIEQISKRLEKATHHL